MRRSFFVLCACLLLCPVLLAQGGRIQFRKVTEPSGKKLDKALKSSQLGQPGSAPFHVKLTIEQVAGTPGDYDAQIEETWQSPSLWRRVITAHGVSQTEVVNESGTHFVSSGTYFPRWLQDFVNALFNPVPDAAEWDHLKPDIEYIVLPNGVESEHCEHQEFMLGTSPIQQVNFANICFDKHGMIGNVQSPSYNASFSNYVRFGHLEIARVNEAEISRVVLKGTVEVLEEANNVSPDLFTTPANATTANPFNTMVLSADQVLKLSGGVPQFQWPNPIPGKGMFTAWVSLDRNGTVREAWPLNSDESEIAAEMTAQLIGRKWRQPMAAAGPVQAEGPVIIAYPPGNSD